MLIIFITWKPCGKGYQENGNKKGQVLSMYNEEISGKIVDRFKKFNL